MTCEVIRDLLPLCADGVASQESEALVRTHIRSCEGCRALYKKMCRQVEPEITDEELNYMAAVKRQNRENRRFVLRVYGIALGIALLFGAMWLIDHMIRYESWMYDTVTISREEAEKEMPEVLLTKGEKELAKVIFSLPEVQPYLTSTSLPPSELPEETVKELLRLAGKDPAAVAFMGCSAAQTCVWLDYEEDGVYYLLEFLDPDTSGHVDILRKYAREQGENVKKSYHAEINGAVIGVWGEDEEKALQQEEFYTTYQKVTGKRQWLDFLKEFGKKEIDGVIPYS